MDVVRFIKNWTLPVAMTTGIVAYLLFHFVPVLQPIGRWYAPYNDNVLPDFMFLILFVTFCKVDYKRLIPVKWHLWIGHSERHVAELHAVLMRCDNRHLVLYTSDFIKKIIV